VEPVATPEFVIAILDADQTPPLDAVEYVAEFPTQIVLDPVIAEGVGTALTLTVTDDDDEHPFTGGSE
ncbi:hypothetical protein EBX93_16905, partial [bacterium]|nr:hypothetical protein [bacterium]